ncbi:MAG TPA: hypothetical protein VKV21_06500 [Solirubrobacteraceae bacterium]|nr:hypothetical protein [Solirubrobacteraceae bacterium]
MPLRPHRFLVGLLLTLATWTGVASIGARSVDDQLLSRPGWTSTSHRLIENRQVRRAIARFSVDRAFGAAGIDAAISRLLPDGLAAQAERRLHRVGTTAADAVLSSRAGRRAWQRASDQAQSDLLTAIDSPGARRSVVLNLSPLLRDIVDGVAGSAAARAIPGSSQLLAVRSSTAGRLVVLRPRQLRPLRTGVSTARTLGWALPAITLGLYALALLLGYGWRARVLSRIGYSLAAAGALALALRYLLQYPLSAVFVSSGSDRSAVRAAWLIGTSRAETLAIEVLIAGAVIAVLSWLLRAATR